VREALVPPATGEAVLPVAPMYHWKETALLAATLSVVDWPDVMVFDCGCVVIAGAVHGGGEEQELPPSP
jgi:hypothetical protein